MVVAMDTPNTLVTAKGLKADVFLAGHTKFFGMEEKRARLTAGEADAFVDPAALSEHVARTEEAFLETLEATRPAAASGSRPCL